MDAAVPPPASDDARRAEQRVAQALAGCPPPDRFFASDNSAGVDPAVMAAVAAAADGHVMAYGGDPATGAAVADLRALFGAPVGVAFAPTGTGANCLALEALAGGGAVVAAANAHVSVDEDGAVEQLADLSIVTVELDPATDRLDPRAVAEALDRRAASHPGQPLVLTATQATELGRVYPLDELAALAELAHARGARFHVDGARLANALVTTGDAPADLLAAGVDAISFGCNKNGGLFGDAVVFARADDGARARAASHRRGQLLPKQRYVGVAISALLADGRWLDNARRANAAAARLSAGLAALPPELGVTVAVPTEANGVFVVLPRPVLRPLADWSMFHVWDSDRNLARFLAAFDTTDTDVERLLAGIEAGAGAGRGPST